MFLNEKYQHFPYLSRISIQKYISIKKVNMKICDYNRVKFHPQWSFKCQDIPKKLCFSEANTHFHFRKEIKIWRIVNNKNKKFGVKTIIKSGHINFNIKKMKNGWNTLRSLRKNLVFFFFPLHNKSLLFPLKVLYKKWNRSENFLTRRAGQTWSNSRLKWHPTLQWKFESTLFKFLRVI